MESFKEVSDVIRVDTGQVIHKPSEDHTKVYMIVAGEAQTIIHKGDAKLMGPRIEPGRLFGGLGLIRDNDKVLEVLATKPTTLLVTSLRQISGYRENKPEEGSRLLQNVLKRVQLFHTYLDQFAKEMSSPKKTIFIEEEAFKGVIAPEDEASYLMTKSFKCPICGGVTEAKVIRGTKIKMTAPGDFFVNYYDHIEPLWYSFVTCTSCGFTERQESFISPIKYDVEAIKKALGQVYVRGQVVYSEPRNLNEVVNGYLMYEQTQLIRKVGDRVIARGKLTIYEILNRAGLTDEAKGYRDQAFDFYSGMFESGILDVNDLQLQQLYLILGKLHEHRGSYEEAKASYRNAKMIKGVEDPKFIELAEEFLIELDDISPKT